MKKKYTFISRRLKLVLIFGCLGGLVVTLFGIYVGSISDLPTGPAPLSWNFKSSSARVTKSFSNGKTKMEVHASRKPDIPQIDKAVPPETALALFALGWFWSVDSRFGSIPGVIRTTVGYSGGTTASPTYKSIGDHSEVIRVEFDPAVVRYKELLDVFWESHDPTYNSYFTQYRNAIFPLTESQFREAESSLKAKKEAIRTEMFTVVEHAGTFYAAEDYHQKYLLRKASGILQELQAIYPETQSLINSTAAARINGYLGCNGGREALKNDLPQLGLSQQMQEMLIEYLTTSCDKFSGLTCPPSTRTQ